MHRDVKCWKLPVSCPQTTVLVPLLTSPCFRLCRGFPVPGERQLVSKDVIRSKDFSVNVCAYVFGICEWKNGIMMGSVRLVSVGRCWCHFVSVCDKHYYVP